VCRAIVGRDDYWRSIGEEFKVFFHFLKTVCMAFAPMLLAVRDRHPGQAASLESGKEAYASWYIVSAQWVIRGSLMREDAEQWVTSTYSLERTASDNLEASRTHNCFHIGLKPLLHVCIALHSGDRRLYPFRLGPSVQSGKKETSVSQNRSKTQERFSDFARANMKQTKRGPNAIESCLGKCKRPHVHFLHEGVWDSLACNLYETIGQVNGCDGVSQLGKSLGIHSRTATTIEDLRSSRQVGNELLSILLYELVGLLKVVTIVLRPFVVCLFDMPIIWVFGLHFDILATQGRVREKKMKEVRTQRCSKAERTT
jgi:hypothetical protein